MDKNTLAVFTKLNRVSFALQRKKVKESQDHNKWQNNVMPHGIGLSLNVPQIITKNIAQDVLGLAFTT